MTWGKTKYRHPDRRKVQGWKWFTHSKWGPHILLVLAAAIIAFVF